MLCSGNALFSHGGVIRVISVLETTNLLQITVCVTSGLHGVQKAWVFTRLIKDIIMLHDGRCGRRCF